MHERHSHTSTRRSPHGQQPSFQDSNMQPNAPQQQAATDTFSQVRPAGGSMNGHAQHAVGTADAVVQGMHSRCSEADALARVDCGPERDFSRPQQQSGACASCSSVDGCKPLHQQTRDYGGVSVQGQSQHADVNFRTNTAQFSPWPQALREQQSVQDNGCCVWQETADDLSDLWAMVQRYLRRKRLRGVYVKSTLPLYMCVRLCVWACMALCGTLCIGFCRWTAKPSLL